MQLFVKGQSLHTVEVTGSESISYIKACVEVLEGLSCEDQILSFRGTPLQDDALISQSGIEEFSTIDVSSRVLGGKVHGSLARAGKVRGQTPKVGKMDRTGMRRRRVGRAKKRYQYNCRILNPPAVIGRKKGPNSNS